jgi:surfactin synthase thioesterase subunit
MDEPIEILGQMVADEVMNELMKTHNNYKHINFIGYSLGGILAR